MLGCHEEGTRSFKELQVSQVLWCLLFCGRPSVALCLTMTVAQNFSVKKLARILAPWLRYKQRWLCLTYRTVVRIHKVYMAELALSKDSTATCCWYEYCWYRHNVPCLYTLMHLHCHDTFTLISPMTLRGMNSHVTLFVISSGHAFSTLEHSFAQARGLWDSGREHGEGIRSVRDKNPGEASWHPEVWWEIARSGSLLHSVWSVNQKGVYHALSCIL